MLQPQDLHVALHARVGMVRAVVGQRLHVGLGKRKVSHAGPPYCCVSSKDSAYGCPGPLLLPCCVMLARVEYNSPYSVTIHRAERERGGGWWPSPSLALGAGQLVNGRISPRSRCR